MEGKDEGTKIVTTTQRENQHLPLGRYVQVDVIIPIHNAAETLEETVTSALHQTIPNELLNVSRGNTPQLHVRETKSSFDLHINVCCYDDGSTDASWDVLKKLQARHGSSKAGSSAAAQEKSVDTEGESSIPSRLLIGKSPEGVGRGAGYARNRAAELSADSKQNGSSSSIHFLCLLDSDDVMHPTRVAEQTSGMLALSEEERDRTIMGCKVVRDPPDSTWHYTAWANGLTDERLLLERFREVTLLQPTWMMCRSRFDKLGGYIEAPKPGVGLSTDINCKSFTNTKHPDIMQLIHPTFDSPQTLRLAEDLRFFHAHIHANGLLRLHRARHSPDMPLVTYRHRLNQSQSYQTSRKLLLHLRALAFEKCILKENSGKSTNNDAWKVHDGKFVVWGAGRDGKDFVKALSEEARKRVFCFVDVDFKKIKQGFYDNRELGLRIPIVHFSLLVQDPEIRKQLLQENTTFGQISKSKGKDRDAQIDNQPDKKKQKLSETMDAASPQVAKSVDLSILPNLPVVVCVAMYRTNGALEKNVGSVGRVEGKSLWHFS